MRLPPSTTAQRAPFYEDVETLISPGFLHHTVTLEGNRLCFRTLGPGDLFLLRARTEKVSEREWKVWAISTSLWMVNGFNLLDDPSATPFLAKKVGALPTHLINILFSNVLGLFARLNRAAEALDAYLYEDRARSRWRMMGGHTFSAHAGIPGVERIGTNYIQRIWMAFNEAEDIRISEDHAWEGFKLVAGTNAPKGIKKLDARDTQTRQDEKARRQSVMDRYYYYRVGLVDREGFLKGQGKEALGSRAVGYKTDEDLEDEMRRWVAGEEDEHDRIVHAYKTAILARQEQVRQQRQVAHQEYLASLQQTQEAEDEDYVPNRLVAFSPEQLHEILRKRNPGRPGARWVGDAEGVQQERLSNKYLGKKVIGPPVDPQVLKAAQGHSLGEALSQRDVKFHGDD